MVITVIQYQSQPRLMLTTVIEVASLSHILHTYVYFTNTLAYSIEKNYRPWTTSSKNALSYYTTQWLKTKKTQNLYNIEVASLSHPPHTHTYLTNALAYYAEKNAHKVLQKHWLYWKML